MLLRDQKLGKYKIVSPLGSGGFGSVYLAVDTWIDKRVALKVPHRQNINFGELLREPRLLAALNHPNIIAITTAEKQENLFFIVMEYVKGETLENLITAKGTIPINHALDYAIQTCQAVQHAHTQGVLHRDLRPPNMLVSEEGVIKVADFGTSRFVELSTKGTTVIGSPPYMAPEQFEGKATFASDIYALGVTIYQMLTGSLPYDTPSPSDLDRLMRGELFEPPRSRNSSIPTSLNEIIMKAMNPYSENRYQSANELLTALEGTRDRRVQHLSMNQNYASPTSQLNNSPPSGQEISKRQTPDDNTTQFCWHCHKPLHARNDRCPFCDEIQ